MDEVDSLISILGVNPVHLHSIPVHTLLPSVAGQLSDLHDINFDDSKFDAINAFDSESTELHSLVSVAEARQVSCSKEEREQFTKLTYASLALAAQ
ncbi:hypothetical protein Agabi119p4_9228 [Agaricus bisporus var. burnettii]|uniref:Uncharacterized protein n=1 Tax=Agaricus bisporus var. burnettii TaxID=192524 RepID=A0A8H7C5Y9_AGABI|nr:hypothetical protein Agabi119p4_9228 [Agaricus bisporus var. burnettii]